MTYCFVCSTSETSTLVFTIAFSLCGRPHVSVCLTMDLFFFFSAQLMEIQPGSMHITV